MAKKIIITARTESPYIRQEVLTAKALKRKAARLGLPLRQFAKQLVNGQLTLLVPEGKDQEGYQAAMVETAKLWLGIRHIYVNDTERQLATNLVVTNDRGQRDARNRNDSAVKRPALDAAKAWNKKLWTKDPPRRGVPVTKGKKAA